MRHVRSTENTQCGLVRGFLHTLHPLTYCEFTAQLRFLLSRGWNRTSHRLCSGRLKTTTFNVRLSYAFPFKARSYSAHLHFSV